VRRVYCSDAARLRGDDNIASAARVDVWILVELPITWGHDPLYDAAIPEAVRQSLLTAVRTITRSRIVFIRRRVECLGPVRVYIARSSPRPGLSVHDAASIDEVAGLDFATMVREARPPAKPLVLVCTHGQHDSCCGRRGYPLYDALRSRDDLDVWQCSHIGGDRFAANALALPWGIYYGPVEPHAADAFAESVTGNQIYLSGYRGRATHSRPVQAADTFIRRMTNELARDAYRLVIRELLVDGRLRVVLRDRQNVHHEVTMEHYVAAEDALTTCASREPQPIRQFRLVDYRLVTETT
jgi:hypothetical protein